MTTHDSSTVTQPGLALPEAPWGRPTAGAKAAYDAAVRAWCEAILELRSRLDFDVSTRGWCYLLEAHGLAKGDFDKAERLITSCRKRGLLPLDICADDASRAVDGIQKIDDSTPEDEAETWIYTIQTAHERYMPRAFWDDQPYCLVLWVEKVDLKSLFADICSEFYLPRANAKGWSDLNGRAELMRRFQAAEARGQIPVLLYCGDLDPAGILISDRIRDNMRDLAHAAGWDPSHLEIDRFGLNADFVERHGLTWIDGLKTGSGDDLSRRDHPDHRKRYVQEYLATFGPRKCEANALVAAPEAGRQLLRDTIAKYVAADAVEQYQASLRDDREVLRLEILRRVREMAAE